MQEVWTICESEGYVAGEIGFAEEGERVGDGVVGEDAPCAGEVGDDGGCYCGRHCC